MRLKNTLVIVHLKILRYLITDVRVRFAPSPTGQLHLGGLRTALYNHLFARKHRAKFILRIEDTDQTRIIPNAVENLIDILKWVDIKIDEGPFQGGSFGPYIQSERLDLYKKYSDKLLENGKAYKCFCTERRLDLLRKNAAARREIPRYDNRCRHLSNSEVLSMEEKGLTHVIRLKLEHLIDTWHDLVYGDMQYDVANNEGDPVIMKSDGFPTYHFANVIDDHHMQITHVLRGLEWQVSTSKHILLYKALGWQPPYFAHLPLLTNKDGKKFSKRQNDVHVEYYRDKGYFPEAIISFLLQTGSGFNIQNKDHLTIHQLADHFDISMLNTSSSRLNFDNLPELNKLHLKRKLIDPGEINALITKLKMLLLQKYPNIDAYNLNDAFLSSLLNAVKERIHSVEDLLLVDYEFIFHKRSFSCDDISSSLNDEGVIKFLDQLGTVEFTKDNLSNILHDFCLLNSNDGSLSYVALMQSLRLILGGAKKGPSVLEMMLMLGKERTLYRIRQSKDILSKKQLIY